MNTGTIKITGIGEEGMMPVIEVQLVNGTVRMTEAEVARLFGCFRKKIETNLRSIFNERLLREDDVSLTYRYTDDSGKERQTVYYNLDAIIFLSYRINTLEAEIFREFVNTALREHLLKGYGHRPLIRRLYTGNRHVLN